MRSILTAIAIVSAAAAGDGPKLRFEDAGQASGVTEALTSQMCHGAACGDVDGDGDLDVYVGGFADRPDEKYARGKAKLNVLLTGGADGTYAEADAPALALKARTSGTALADLDNDGDLDLYVSNNSKRKGLRVPNALFENVGGGRFRDVSAGNAACETLGGRSVGVLDYDGDGLLDLLVAVDSWTGGATRLYRNTGGLAFEDVTARAGLPEKLPALGVLTPDLNGDTRPDIVIGQANRFFLSAKGGRYVEGRSADIQYDPIGREDTPCGVAMGDVNRDGRLDLVIVDHNQPARQHLFLNVSSGGQVRFKDATEAAGLKYLFPKWNPDRVHLKHAHVEIADFDNDAWPDILIAATMRADGGLQPMVCRNLAAGRGKPVRFDVPDIRKAHAYFAVGPVADFDRDGRLDVMMCSWFQSIPSTLMLNRGPKRHWLGVRVIGRTVNRMGIGSKVRVYAAGGLGRAESLLGVDEVHISEGFCTGHAAEVHFGLGEATKVDLEVTLPHGKGVIRRRGLDADRVVTVREP